MADDTRVCTKRCYASVREARQAHRRASFRLRVYWCDACRAHHVTNDEKLRITGRTAWKEDV